MKPDFRLVVQSEGRITGSEEAQGRNGPMRSHGHSATGSGDDVSGEREGNGGGEHFLHRKLVESCLLMFFKLFCIIISYL